MFSIALATGSFKLSETLFVIEVLSAKFKDLTALERKKLIFLKFQDHLSEFLIFQ